ncbi:ABC transporter ATP-binding protein [Paenibacillus sp. FSL M7-1455]|jgi:ABC-2 type transport system ATP-binding protein|uniref:ABC transporter ATP-binding protein n=1 Tax=Paenibacillus cookii TaxID=157839 RepID=A0ABQ4LZT4_9BACL|nr:ABC transporter ATP-binding protein [Paenibacillus cookii]KHF37299.1 ABC transporter ATP-binding protein YtrB [Paenibacillus sp. P1XP2]GIO68800.1 ABC transporter ATP-binding protein [Paenibacillus cookii]
MNRIVEVNRLNKTYGSETVIQDVSFTIEENKIYGLLGRNGAGKTTIMHMITAQLFPSGGELKVFGEHPYENNRVLTRMSFIKESQKYPDVFRIADVLDIAADLYPNWDQGFAEQLIEDFRLPVKRRMKKLSRGMLSSVGIIVGLASRAPLTIFDEPYLGLDAVARNLFYERLLEDYAEHPRTVILSTHLIDEVSNMLEHVIVIDNGKILLDEEADSLRGKAFTAVGPAATVRAWAAGKQLIHEEAIGGLMSASVLGNLSAAERREAEAQGIELVPVSLQQLIVHLTSGKTNGKVAELG